MTGTLVLFDAAPFCYGPISSLVEFARAFRDCEPTAETVLLATGTAREFAVAEGVFDSVVDCDTEDLPSLEQRRDLFDVATIFVANTNPVSVGYATTLGVRVVHIDLLFWMWDELPTGYADAELIIVPRFPGVDEAFRRFADAPLAARVVGPLLPEGEIAPDGPQVEIIISFGGMQSRLASLDLLAAYVARMVQIVSELAPRRTIAVLVGETLARLVQSNHTAESRAIVGHVPHRDYLGYLRRARHVIANPGILTMYDLAVVGKPAFLLPAHNYSQDVATAVFRAQRVVAGGLSRAELYGAVPPGLPEPVGVQQVEWRLRRLLCDDEAQAEMRDRLRAFLAKEDAELRPAAERLAAFLGPGGLNDTVDAVIALLRRRNGQRG